MCVYVCVCPYVGLSKDTVDNFRQQLSKQAGMAAKLCASVPAMWQMETYLMALSQQASAGARPELFKLLEVSMCVSIGLTEHTVRGIALCVCVRIRCNPGC